MSGAPPEEDIDPFGPDDFSRRIPFLVENYKGVCFAAFCGEEALLAAVGIEHADAIRTRALNDFMGLMSAVRRAKERARAG